MTRRPDDEGSTLILTIFYGALSLLLILIVAAATSLYLERRQLFAIADAASLVGAEAFSLAEVTTEGGAPELSLAPDDVDDAVTAFLEDPAFDDVEGLTIERATSLDGVSATVTVSSWWRPPVLTLFVPEGIRVEATSVARSVFD
ncbi:pilus assembly protein TadG-related protein [Paramicrobacterium agarici]|uniref:Putative Flp pilus-assembly TadG-like N-terminal domain-containing protein n=1 Tax=Paramicrobacterium agarici TaxID=630514 RepID=A0A2A9DYZ9_9MICO|nr:pilus assembly protein TadG-related protein [Microbacterium agarici]PFG31596.1 hypothetical protein ATJ78_2571 [Microbacterium agarici]